jgi:hypothetical protein
LPTERGNAVAARCPHNSLAPPKKLPTTAAMGRVSSAATKRLQPPSQPKVFGFNGFVFQ